MNVSLFKMKSNYVPFNVLNFIAFILLNTNLNSVKCCDIWKMTECSRYTITTAEEALMKTDDYTKEQLYKYCDKGKAYVDCVNERLKCCDLRSDLKGALNAYEKQLEKQAWKLGPYCSGLGGTNVVQYKCRTTTRKTTKSITKFTKPTLAPCKIEQVYLKILLSLFLYFINNQNKNKRQVKNAVII